MTDANNDPPVGNTAPLRPLVERQDELRKRMETFEATADELREYCHLSFPPKDGFTVQDPAVFVQDDSVIAAKWLYDWWQPDEYPPRLGRPTIVGLLWNIYVANGAQPVSFNHAVMQYHARCVKYCEENDINPETFKETPEEKRKRRNRDQMAKARAARRLHDKQLPDNPELVNQIRKLESDRAELKLAAKAEDERLRLATIDLQNQMVAMANQRKQAAQHYKDQIEVLSDQILQLAAKQ